MSIEKLNDGFGYAGENGLEEYASGCDEFVVVCDLCGDDLCAQYSFEDAVEYKKRSGWQSWKDDNDIWMDVCTDCQKRYRRKYNRPSAASDFKGVGLK